MNKNIIRCLFLIVMVISSLSAGKSVLDPYTYNGATTLEHKTLPRLTLHGASTLRDVKVQELIEAHGALIMKKSECGSLNAFGGVEISDTKIHEETTVHGGIFARNTQFLGEVVIQGKAKTIQSLITGSFSSRTLEATGCTFSSTVNVEGICILKKTTVVQTLMVDGSLTTSDNCVLGSIEVKDNCHFANSKIASIHVFGFGTKEIYLTGDAQVLGDITFALGEGVVFVEHPGQIKGTVRRGVIKEIGNK